MKKALALLWLVQSGLSISLAGEMLSTTLVGTWLHTSDSGVKSEDTYLENGSFVHIIDQRAAGGSKRVETGKWHLQGNRLFLHFEGQPDPMPWATIRFDGQDTMVSEDKYDVFVYRREDSDHPECEAEPPVVAAPAGTTSPVAGSARPVQRSAQNQTPLQQIHSILDIKDPAQKNAAGLAWFRDVMLQMDEITSAAGMDPRALEYETFYQQARESGAQPTEADWEARKDMKNMEIFRQGGIPPNF